MDDTAKEAKVSHTLGEALANQLKETDSVLQRELILVRKPPRLLRRRGGGAPNTQNLGEELGQVCVRSMATCCDTARGYATSLRTRASYLF